MSGVGDVAGRGLSDPRPMEGSLFSTQGAGHVTLRDLEVLGRKNPSYDTYPVRFLFAPTPEE